MLVTDYLIRRLEKAENPRAIQMLSRALTVTTGIDMKGIAVGEQRSAPPNFNPDYWQHHGYYRIASGLGGGTSYSGQRITRDSALESAAMLAGVKIISEDIGTMPLFLYRRSADGKSVEKATDHELFRILHDLPNPEMSAGEFREALTAHAILTGNGYALIQRGDTDKKIKNLWPLQPEAVTMARDKTTSALIYKYNGVEYTRDQIFHLRGWTLNGVEGENILQRARHVLGLTLATQEYPARWFAQGSMLDVVLERPATAVVLKADGIQLVKEGWIKWHRGLGRTSYEPAVLQEGMTAKTLTPKFSETQMVEQRKFQVLEVCRILRLPPHKLADIERAGYNSIEAENTAYRTNTLSPWDRRWSETAHRCLLTPAEQIEGRLYAEHNMEALLRGDFKTQADGFRVLLEGGVYTINEVRRWFNLNPTEGGDNPTIQLNRIDVAALASAASGALTTVAGRTGALGVAR